MEQAGKTHALSEQFLSDLFSGKMKEFMNKLLDFNKAVKVTPNCCKTMFLIDATFSMSELLMIMKSKLQIMLDRIKAVLKQNGMSDELVLMKFAIYRNYDQTFDMIY